jgi:superfamily II DNA or RNA helicase
MLNLTTFQRAAVEKVVLFSKTFSDYKSRLASINLPTTAVGSTAWNEVTKSSGVYSELLTKSGESIPNCSITIPTGGGKTLVGLSCAIELLINSETINKPIFIVWLVPNDAIYRQVISTFSPGGIYYNTILGLYSKNIKLKLSSDFWVDSDLESHDEITILLLSKDSLVRDTRKKHGLLIYRNPDQVSGLTILRSVSSPSLFSLIREVKPIFVIDEAHRIYTEIGQQFFKENEISSFILELTATPKAYDETHKPNVIFRARGNDLIEHGLIKKSIKYNATVGQDTADLLKDVRGLQSKLEEKFRQLGMYVIPRVLISVEFTGSKKSSEEHSIAHIETLLDSIGVTKEERVIKTSERDQLKDRNLDDPADPARYILTKTALVEGWDCKSVYVIVLLNNIGASLTNTQIVGRGLRQPRQSYFSDDALNTLFLITNSTKHDQSIREVKEYLFESGLSDIEVKRGASPTSQELDVRLLKDPAIHYVNFDRAIYHSRELRTEVDSHFLNNIKVAESVFDHSDIEHIQTSVDIGSGKVGALSFKTIQRRESILSDNSVVYQRLFKKLFFTLRPYFFDSLKCGKFVEALLQTKFGVLLGAPEETILERCKTTLISMKQEYLDSRFTELLHGNSELVNGKISKLFSSSFVISTGTQDRLDFESCLLSEVPSDFLNTQELEFARFLDKSGVSWLKTTPSFKIDFPYPLGTFYPDFLVVPTASSNKTTFYIETKGAHLLMNDESRAKSFSCDVINEFSGGKLKMIFGDFSSCERALIDSGLIRTRHNSGK